MLSDSSIALEPVVAAGSLVLAVTAVLITIPVAVFAVEVFAGVARGRREPAARPGLARLRVGVLVPAHNEGQALLPTLNDIRMQLRPGDRLLVIADNCQDETASIAAAAGAEVAERQDPARRGKGYALDWGIRHFDADPPEIVMVIDADCRLEHGAIDRLAETCARTRRPVQALYIMTAPAGGSINLQVAAFAWRVKNQIRPAGLRALHLPCQLMGTGMAFPWAVLREANMRSSEIVEDLKLGLDLAAAGHPPLFCPSAVVRSEFPSSVASAATQRQRWEHGHLRLLLTETPRLVRLGLRRADVALIALALDLAVPPLALLVLMVIGSLALGGLAALLGASVLAMSVSAASLAVLTTAVLAAWVACGREILPGRALLAIAPYIGRKVGLYPRALVGRGDVQWIRTDRAKPDV